MDFSSRRSLAILVLIRRRSVSILVSPGPRPPIPPPAAPTRPPAWRDRLPPQPRSRCFMYCSWASSTWALPSLLFACWAKMSRISAVRSTTLTLSLSSRLRSCAGASSPSAITVSAPSDATRLRRSDTLPEPMKVAGSGFLRRWITPSSTSEPAVSASSFSSASEFSASSALPSVQTPTSSTRSSSSLRYSTSLMSVSSVDMPTTRRSAWRSSSSSLRCPSLRCSGRSRDPSTNRRSHRPGSGRVSTSVVSS